MKSAPILIALAFSLSIMLRGQDAAPKHPEFEVASVRYVAEPDYLRAPPQNRDPGFVLYRRQALKALLMKAFKISYNQCDGPSWLDQAHYDITAKVPETALQSEIPAMLQSLLVERFGLSFHWETRTEAGYALVVGKNGPRLKKSTEVSETKMTKSGHFEYQGIDMPKFAENLAANLGQPVLDKTDINGEFDIVMDVDPERIPAFAQGLRGMNKSPDAEFAKPTISSAVDRLGLKLEARKVELKHLVVDQIKQIPTANDFLTNLCSLRQIMLVESLAYERLDDSLSADIQILRRLIQFLQHSRR